jgi:hypothetical protein
MMWNRIVGPPSGIMIPHAYKQKHSKAVVRRFDWLGQRVTVALNYSFSPAVFLSPTRTIL